MRIIILLLILPVILFSCSKSGNNTGTTVPPVVIGGPITITAITPAKPYADDTITITGTGFNPDKTKDTVDFGIGDAAPGYFNPYFNGNGTASKAIIISASSTQLVIKALNADSGNTGLDRALFNGVPGNNPLNQIRVRSLGAKVSKLTPFNELPWIQITNSGGYPLAGLAPNDSFEVAIHGVNSNSSCGARLSMSCGNITGCTFVNGYLTYNGNTPQCVCDVFGTIVYGCMGNVFTGKLISHTAALDVVHCLLPANFFNTTYSANAAANNFARILVKMRVENPDGKTRTVIPVICLAYPTHP